MKKILHNGQTDFFLEAHNALSAQIVEEAGFPGIWVSSLGMSASWGVKDNNELTMSQTLDILESITEKVTIPVLFDGDTGYGDHNHFQMLVRKLQKRNCAGVCIEDKIFPKRNSFIRSEEQVLEDIGAFCDKIKVGKDAVRQDFSIIARTEALVTGAPMEEAIERAFAYANAGADAILIHSKSKSIDEVEKFTSAWDYNVPLVCVPTKFSSTPREKFSELNFSLVIIANHMLRASIHSMQAAASRLLTASAIADVEPSIASLEEVFRLQADA